MSELFDRLQTALAPNYRLIKELGGGGMSRVFLAEETELQRQVVIKVLPPDMSPGVNKERFQREIRLAASLQHPHIVPLLTAGSAADLLYYVMPYIEGESLRAKLAREGELPVGEAARILRDVVDALSAAHHRGVVHRDIKPDNVMISGHHALVADFGVAKAVTASSGDAGTSLTSLGIALGTPAYMAPEQAAADPHTDHRADIYAVGALAYEMLTSLPPFTGPTPQSVLAAHVTQAPTPVTQRRPAVPPAMAMLVMRCLEKRPADRWQTADELMTQLAAIVTPTGGMTPTGTAPVPAVGTVSAETAVRRAHPLRVAGLYALASVAVLGIAYLLMMRLGLPDWLFAGAVGLMLVGLPIMLYTSRLERNRAVARLTGTMLAVPSGGLHHLFTWKRALWGGGLAFGSLGLATGVYMAMRLLGIGPAGTLLASGALAGHDRLLLTDFENRTADSTLGETVTELFRIDLAQSRRVSFLEPQQVEKVLRRMERKDSIITPALAREIAIREGLKAYVTGDIRSLGTGYIISTRLIAAGTGDALFSGRETANTSDEVIKAVDRLSGQLREKIGESLRTVRADPALEDVTTSSTEALRLYAQGTRAGSVQGDYRRGVDLFRQAVALDSNFAMAWRRLSAYASNAGMGAVSDSAIKKAWALRDHLAERERLLVEADYSRDMADDPQATAGIYRTLLEKYPDDQTALNNGSLAFGAAGLRDDASAALRHAIALGGASAVSYGNLVFNEVRRGQPAAADSFVRMIRDSFPGNPYGVTFPPQLLASRGEFDSAEVATRAILDSVPAGTNWQAGVLFRMGSLAQVRGGLAEAEQFFQRAREIRQTIQNRPHTATRRQLDAEGDRLYYQIHYGFAPADIGRRMDDLLRREAAVVPDTERTYIGAAYAFAELGQPERARQFLTQYRRVQDTATVRQFEANDAGLIEAWIGLAEGRYTEAIAGFRRAREKFHCGSCWLWELGLAFDRAGQKDSALAVYQQFLTEPQLNRLDDDATTRAIILRRLGELYEERNDRARALEHYGKFVDLWRNADPELQPQVADVKQRIARLAGEPARP
ncbi:MAG: protein kinase [Gemmatimonadota bacterium]